MINSILFIVLGIVLIIITFAIYTMATLGGVTDVDWDDIESSFKKKE